MGNYRFHNCKHFCDRYADRGFSFEEAKSVVNYPETQQEQYRGFRGGKVKMFTKRINGRRLTVIAEIVKNDAHLMTAYYE